MRRRLPTELARLARTVRSLHPIQVAARPVHLLLGRAIRDVPTVAAPELRTRWPEPPAAVKAYQLAEAQRAAARLARIPPDSLLHRFERCYGFELAQASEVGSGLKALWADRVALHPYPASVRARRIACAVRTGASQLRDELARACRAVALQLELHLLGNHLLENGIGLVCGGAAAHGPEADAWWRLGAAILDSQLRAQFLEDGGHFERSATYHLWLLGGLLEAIELARAAGREVPPLWSETASRALGWALAVRAPDGTYPLFNDAMLDGGPTIDAVCALAPACGIEVPDAPVIPRDRPWVRELPETGWLLMGWGAESFFALDVGPDGASNQPGHAHADHLTFELWLRGQRVCVDYGVSSYAPSADREQCRSTRVHNTVEIDGENSVEVWAAFRVGRRSSGRLISLKEGDGFMEAVATHDGYRWLENAPVHVRTVRLERERLRIEDRVAGRARSAVSRIRLCERSVSSVRLVSQPAPCVATDGEWFPELGNAQKARVFESPVGPEHPRCEWTIEWMAPSADVAG